MTLFKFTTFRSLSVLSGLCVALLAPSTASAVIMDNFTDALSISRTGVGATGPIGQTLLPGVLGGARNSEVGVTSVTGVGTKRSDLDIGGGGLLFSSTSGTTGYFEITYPFSPVVDVDGGAGQVFFQFTINDNDNGGVFSLTVFDGTNTGTKFLAAGDGDIGSKVIVVSDLGVNLNNLVSAVFRFDGVANADLEIGGSGFEFTSVPEPSSLAIALTGLGMAGVYFRRRRKQLTA